MSIPRGAGADYLKEKSDLARAMSTLPRFEDFLVFEDKEKESNRALALLRAILGYEINVRRAASLSSGIDLMLAKLPDFVLLDDRMGPVDKAEDALPLIWRTGYSGPIVAISSELTRDRRIKLLKLGVIEALHKDDLDSGSIGKVMVRLAEALVAHQAKQQA